MVVVKRCVCGARIWSGRRCPPCQKKSVEERYNLSFTNNYARPSAKFWRAWRKDSNAVKRAGLTAVREDDGWWVRRAENKMR